MEEWQAERFGRVVRTWTDGNWATDVSRKNNALFKWFENASAGNLLERDSNADQNPQRIYRNAIRLFSYAFTPEVFTNRLVDLNTQVRRNMGGLQNTILGPMANIIYALDLSTQRNRTVTQATESILRDLIPLIRGYYQDSIETLSRLARIDYHIFVQKEHPEYVNLLGNQTLLDLLYTGDFPGRDSIIQEMINRVNAEDLRESPNPIAQEARAAVEYRLRYAPLSPESSPLWQGLYPIVAEYPTADSTEILTQRIQSIEKRDDYVICIVIG